MTGAIFRTRRTNYTRNRKFRCLVRIVARPRNPSKNYLLCHAQNSTTSFMIALPGYPISLQNLTKFATTRRRLRIFDFWPYDILQ